MNTGQFNSQESKSATRSSDVTIESDLVTGMSSRVSILNLRTQYRRNVD
jgi:hypothetical protein